MSVSPNPIATGWLNENALREYPFHEGCGLRPNDSAGSLVESGWSVPNSLLVDMSLSVDGSNYDPFLYLGQMSVVGSSVTMVFCDRSGARVVVLYADAGTHSENTAYQVSGTGSFLGARGVVCIGDMNDFLERTPEGVYNFSSSETQIEPTCIRPSIVGVRSIRSVDGVGYSSQMLSGDVKLIAGRNIRLDYSPDDNAIWISADPNSGYSDKCDCGEAESKTVRSINGIAVEDVKIVGDDCVNVDTDTGSGVITITDTCAKPCCGCAETIFINQTINDLQTSVNTLEGNVSSLGDRLLTFVNSYVLSRKTLK